MRKALSRLVIAAAALGISGCNLDVENPNAPDANRAFSDPAGLEQLLSGAFQTWVVTRGDYYSVIPMTAMADNYTASWNNAAIRFYSSVGSECPQRCGWTNSATAPEAAGGPSVESSWYGYYTILSAANDVLAAIDRGVCFDTDCDTDNTITSRNAAVAKMLQGMALSGIALLYDQGFVVDENSDLAAVLTAPFNTRQEVRDAALQKFEDAYAEAGLKTWNTVSTWMGAGGRTYTNTQIRQLIRTMQAELVAMFPRDDAEVTTDADWAAVATYASQGISSGTPFDWEYTIDANNLYLDYLKTWGNSIGTMRVDTRTAAKLTENHTHPWPEPSGNPCPTVPRNGDRRVGDGSWGPTDNFNGYATRAATSAAGTDYACSGVPIFPPARGQYHQSNLQHVRYQHLGFGEFGETLPDADGTGQDPLYTRWMNDLLWAEGLIRSGGNALTAAQRINSSRVGRGGLTPLTGAEGTPALLTALYYEQDIEFMGQGPTPFFNMRRRAPYCDNPCVGVEGLIRGTPRHMPVPAKELDVLLRATYTFGGPNAPAKMRADGGDSRSSVRERWETLRRQVKTEMFIQNARR